MLLESAVVPEDMVLDCSRFLVYSVESFYMAFQMNLKMILVIVQGPYHPQSLYDIPLDKPGVHFGFHVLFQLIRHTISHYNPWYKP